MKHLKDLSEGELLARYENLDKDDKLFYEKSYALRREIIDRIKAGGHFTNEESEELQEIIWGLKLNGEIENG